MVNINELIQDYNEQKTIFKNKLKESFFEFIKEFFVEVPEITVIKWNQFTPYFNDGEECIFRVNSPILSNGTPENVSSYGEYEEDDISKDELILVESSYDIDENSLIQNKEKVKELYKIFDNGFITEIFKDMFGDHVEITATKKGFEIDDYDHD